MATTVTIGGADATDVTVTSATSLTATVPAGTAGDTVDVVVSTSTDEVTVVDGYTFLAVPTVTALDPPCVGTSDSATVTLTGTGFVTGTTVALSGPPNADITIADVTVVSPTELTFTLTTRDQGQGGRAFTVTTPGGSVTTPTITMVSDVALTSINPTSGAPEGGTNVTIFGSGIGTAGATVMFGATEITNGTHTGGSQIAVVAPAGTVGDSVDITVTNCAGSSDTLTDAYTYEQPAPVITSLEPDVAYQGSGTKYTIIGENFSTATNQYRMRLRTTTGTITTVGNVAIVSPGTSTQMTATHSEATDQAPAAGALLTAQLVKYSSTSTVVAALANAVTSTVLPLPTVSNVTPVTGPVSQVVDVTITGTGFIADVPWVLAYRATGATGSNLYTPATRVSDTQLTARFSPPSSPVTYDFYVAALGTGASLTDYVNVDTGFDFVVTAA